MVDEKNSKKVEEKVEDKVEKTQKIKKVKKSQKWLGLALFTILAAGWVFLNLLGSQILVWIVAGLFFSNEQLSGTIANATVSVISYIFTILLVVLLPSKVPRIKNFVKSTRERLGLKGLPTWTDIGLAPVGYIVTILIVAGLTVIFNNFAWFNSEETQYLGYSFYLQGWERGIAFVELAVIAPIIEEIVFRGWLYGNLRVKIPKWLAVLVTSVLFGLVHMQWNVGITTFAMSVIVCLLREVTGSVYAGTLVHIINNTIAFYLVYVAGIA